MLLTASARHFAASADKMLYGHFLEHFHRQIYGGVFDPTSRFADSDGFREDVICALREIRTPILRWPGGCYVSAYNWRLGVGKNRPPVFDKAWRVEDSNAFGTDEFIALCRKIGCEPYICTNAGTGTSEDMSDWVEYCNLKTMGRFAKERIANGHPEPHRVKYWSIGNENWGGHEMGAKTIDEWGRFVTESGKMMLRVDPTIELSAASIEDLDWNISLLRKAGGLLNWISLHSYWTGAPEDGVTFPDYNTLMMTTGDEISGGIDRVRAYLTALGLENKIKIAYDEWNLRGWYHPNVLSGEDIRKEDESFYKNKVIAPRDQNDVNATYTMADAIFSACFLNTCLRNCDLVKMACFSPVVNTRGAIFTHKDGLVLRPQYYVFKLYANLMKKTVLKTWAENVPEMTGTYNGKNKRVDTVDAVLTCEDGAFAVSAVNKDAEKAHTLTLRLLDCTPKEMRIHTLNGKDISSYNDIDRNEVGVSVTPWQPYLETVTLAPHSVNIIEIR